MVTRAASAASVAPCGSPILCETHAQKWPRTWGRSGRFLDRLRFNFGDYVRLRGGEYFFTPSLSFLKNL